MRQALVGKEDLSDDQESAAVVLRQTVKKVFGVSNRLGGRMRKCRKERKWLAKKMWDSQKG